jgi:hypothetical protein
LLHQLVHNIPTAGSSSAISLNISEIWALTATFQDYIKIKYLLYQKTLQEDKNEDVWYISL